MENQNIGLISLLNGIMNHNVIIRTELINIPINHPVQPNAGCSEEFLNNLEEFKVDEEFIKRNLQCSICLEDFKLNDECIILNCNEDKHIFHKGNEHCSGIKPWLERNNTCPMCRTGFPQEDIPDLENINTDENTENINTDENNESIINPNNIENTITNIIHEYMNDMNELAEQRSIQLAIQASLDEQ